MTAAARDNAGKAPLEEIYHFGPALDALAFHSQAGRVKYPDTPEGTPNWKLGQKPAGEYIGAATRHLKAYYGDGEVHDPETRSLHLTSALWNMAAAITLLHADELRAPTGRMSERDPSEQSLHERTDAYIQDLQRKMGENIGRFDPGEFTD